LTIYCNKLIYKSKLVRL